MLDPVAPTSRVRYPPSYQWSILTATDSEEQKKEWQENPDQHAEYCRDVEGELNKRFTLVKPSLFFLAVGWHLTDIS